MGNINQKEATELAQENMLIYGVSVNTDRAIPDARDGMKPVHRRILYDMYDLKLASNKPHKKCARVVGDAMARWHPHGDSSIYGALVRFSQNWSMRYPLVHIHGNNGSVDGDGAASMRYTETRLVPLTEEGILTGLKKQGVEMQFNFDDTELEPSCLPCAFPNLLCNPNRGIGVAMASCWLPHNLVDVCNTINLYLENEDTSIKDLAALMQGPDFPLGGQIINQDELIKIYQTGKGKAVIRAKYTIEERNKTQLLVFTDIPFETTTEALLEEINTICKEKEISDVVKVRNESSLKGIRLVLEMKKGANVGGVVKLLYAHTNLQKSVSANQVALVDKAPTLLTLKDVLKIYVEHQLDVIKNETQYDLTKAEARLEIVEGLLVALEDIDNIIQLIKKSASAAAAKQALSEKYNLSDKQSTAIVDMKLGRLAGLEKMEINNEKNELIKIIDECNNILSNSIIQKNLLKVKLNTLKAKFGDERRTELTNVKIVKDVKEKDVPVPEDVVVVVTENGSVKRVPKASYRSQKRGGKGVKSQDDLVMGTFKTSTVDDLFVFTNKGKMYKILVDKIPTGTNTSKGTSISALVTMEKGEFVQKTAVLKDASIPKNVIFVTKGGMIKKTLLSEYADGARRAAGIKALKLKDGDSLANVIFMDEEEIILVTKYGKAIRFVTSTIAAIGKVGLGVKGINLDAGDEVAAALPVHKLTDNLAIVTSTGYAKQVKLDEFSVQNKGGKGVICLGKGGHTVAGIAMVDEEDSLLICGETKNICFAAKDISVVSRISLGTQAIKENTVKAIAKI